MASKSSSRTPLSSSRPGSSSSARACSSSGGLISTRASRNSSTSKKSVACYNRPACPRKRRGGKLAGKREEKPQENGGQDAHALMNRRKENIERGGLMGCGENGRDELGWRLSRSVSAVCSWLEPALAHETFSLMPPSFDSDFFARYPFLRKKTATATCIGI